jgi:hypothetical protein
MNLWRTFPPVFLAALLLAGCQVPINPSSQGTLVLTLGSWGRTVLPDLQGVVDHYEVKLAQTGGSSSTKTLLPTDVSATWTGLTAGTYVATVWARTATDVVLGSGTQSGTLTTGGHLVLAVSLTPVASTASQGYGAVGLSVRVPLAVGYGTYNLVNASGSSVASGTMAFTANATNRETVVVAAVPAGPYTLTLSFRYGSSAGALAGTYVEAVDVWPTMTADHWLSPDGVLSSVFELTASDLGSSNALLSDLSATVAGVAATLTKVPTTATQALSRGFSPTEVAYFLVVQAGVAVTLEPKTDAGQSVVCQLTQDNGASTVTLGPTVSLTADKPSVVSVVVTAADGTTQSYQVTLVVPEALNSVGTLGSYTHSVALLGRAVVQYSLVLANSADWVTVTGLPSTVRIDAALADGTALTPVAGALVPGESTVVLTVMNTSTGSLVASPPTLTLTDTSAGTGSLATTLADGTETNPVVLASDGSYLYFGGAGANGTVFRQALTGTAAPETLVSGFSYVHGLAYTNGQLFVSDINTNAVYRVDLATREVSLFAGSPGQSGDVPADTSSVAGTSARFKGQRSLETDGTWLYVADDGNNKVRKISLTTGVVTTLAGSGTAAEVDGTGAGASFYGPVGLALSHGVLYVADFDGRSIRKVDPATGLVITFLTLTNRPWDPDSDGTSLYVPSVPLSSDGANGVVEKYTLSDQTLTRTYTGFNIPYGVLVGTQTPPVLYAADPYAHFVQARF